ncbi:unnamed protein product, partial [Amoebophrya sp. A120]|eukprot:GSA120T00003269001.1
MDAEARRKARREELDRLLGVSSSKPDRNESSALDTTEFAQPPPGASTSHTSSIDLQSNDSESVPPASARSRTRSARARVDLDELFKRRDNDKKQRAAAAQDRERPRVLRSRLLGEDLQNQKAKGEAGENSRTNANSNFEGGEGQRQRSEIRTTNNGVDASGSVNSSLDFEPQPRPGSTNSASSSTSSTWMLSHANPESKKPSTVDLDFLKPSSSSSSKERTRRRDEEQSDMIKTSHTVSSKNDSKTSPNEHLSSMIEEDSILSEESSTRNNVKRSKNYATDQESEPQIYVVDNQVLGREPSPREHTAEALPPPRVLFSASSETPSLRLESAEVEKKLQKTSLDGATREDQLHVSSEAPTEVESYHLGAPAAVPAAVSGAVQSREPTPEVGVVCEDGEEDEDLVIPGLSHHHKAEPAPDPAGNLAYPYLPANTAPTAVEGVPAEPPMAMAEHYEIKSAATAPSQHLQMTAAPPTVAPATSSQQQNPSICIQEAVDHGTVTDERANQLEQQLRGLVTKCEQQQEKIKVLKEGYLTKQKEVQQLEAQRDALFAESESNQRQHHRMEEELTEAKRRLQQVQKRSKEASNGAHGQPGMTKSSSSSGVASKLLGGNALESLLGFGSSSGSASNNSSS